MNAHNRARGLIELVVHELRTPLNVASGSLRMLAGTPELPDGERSLTERALRACEQLERVTGQMRDWARLLSEAAPVHKVQLMPALHEAARQVEAAYAGVHVAVQEDGKPPDVMSLSGRLSHALSGIVAAVARPATAGSTVRVRIAAADEQVALHIGDTEGSEGDALTFEVDGIGGLGFALPLAQQIVTASGGRLGLLLNPHGRVRGAVVLLLRARE